ncbi:MAG TPA: outer membrane beta-barrel protein [Candidatus Kapabacteria bacterium]|nr:outer membrane beta-barrel protein [Candidatus Kapabacteria bacterium]
MKAGLKKIWSVGLSIVLALTLVATAGAQTPISPGAPSTVPDTAMIFQPAHPLIQNATELAKENPNTWGLDASFSDYGFGGGAFLGHTFGPNITGMLSLDFGTAEGSKEFDLLEVNKINRIFVIPIMASLQYRVFRNDLSDNLRPYVAAGVGPVIAMTTPYAEDFFSAFGSAQAKVVPGGYIGLGANFGMDPKTNFGASLRYFIIPYPGAIESTTSESLTNLSGLFLTVSYGFNF